MIAYQGPFPHRLSLFENPNEYNNSLSSEFNKVTAENVQAILQQAIWEFELLAGNEAYSGFYFVDWRINFEPVEKYVKANLKLLPQWAALYFLTLHDNAADILHERLEIV
jgi:hypothetical protein